MVATIYDQPAPQTFFFSNIIGWLTKEIPDFERHRCVCILYSRERRHTHTYVFIWNLLARLIGNYAKRKKDKVIGQQRQ